MGIFKKIAQAVRKVTGNSHSETVDSREVAADTLQLAEMTLRYLKNKELRKEFVDGLQIAEKGRKQYLSGSVYDYYFKHSGIHGEKLERRMPLSSWISVLEAVCADASHIEQTVDFTQHNDAEVAGLSNLAIDGFFYGAQRFCLWIFYLLATSEAYRPDGKKVTADTIHRTVKKAVENSPYVKTPKGAPYMAKQAKELTPEATNFAKTVLDRRRGEDFVSMIKAMKSSGRDVALKTAGHLIDTYANEHDYSKPELNYIELGLRSPITALITTGLLKRKEMYDRNKATRDWLALNVSRFSLNAAQTPEDSPEHKRYARLAQNYLDLVSEYDKKLASQHDAL